MKCIVCNGENFKNVVARDKYKLMRCDRCGQGILDPIPSRRVLQQIYSDVNYHNDKTKKEHQAEALVRAKVIASTISEKRVLLDFGCGTGDLLVEMNKRGFKVFGFDINYTHTQRIKSHSDGIVLYKNVNQILDGSLDVITCFDVIEHIVEPEILIDRFYKWLKPGGKLIITTPNNKSLDARLFGKKWYGYTKIPQHIHYFNVDSLTLLLKKVGFTDVVNRQWGFCRSLQFIVKHMPFKRYCLLLLDVFGLREKILFVPVVDMMVTANKPL